MELERSSRATRRQKADPQHIYDNAMSLAKSFDESFVELGATLRQLQDTDSDRYRDFIKASGIGERKAYYLIAIDKTFKDLKVPKKLLIGIGWTKLIIIEPHVNKDNWKDLFDFAAKHTAAELKAYVKGENTDANARSVLLYFTPVEYETLMSALLQHGAHKARRGVQNKERALMKLIEVAKPKQPA
jgi:hypothetical protein